jgi:hypothetical protein
MNLGFDVVFFKPSTPDQTMNGRMFINLDGRNYLDYKAESLTEMYNPLPVYYATNKLTKEEYTLINGTISQTESGIYRFEISELYRGAFLKSVLEEDMIQMQLRFSGLTNWLNKPTFKLSLSNDLHEAGNVHVLPMNVFSFPIQGDILLELSSWSREYFNSKEVSLQSLSQLRIIADAVTSRYNLFHIATAFVKLISLFVQEIPRIQQVSYSLNNGIDIDYITNKEGEFVDSNKPLMEFSKLQASFESILDIFFKRENEFVKPIDLINESKKNRTAEVSFLNVTTAMEVFHKSFLSNSESNRLRLMNELMSKKIIHKTTKNWDQIIRYYHLFEIAKTIKHIQSLFPDVEKTIVSLRNSRNYYTHYSTRSNQVWTPNELVTINRNLHKLIKVAILKQLLVPDDLIIMIVADREHYIYHNYEDNEYSVKYLPSSANTK